MNDFSNHNVSGVKSFVDYLMKIYDDSMRSTNPSWKAGREMFENKTEYRNEDITGFKPELTAYNQGAEVTRHVLGHAGVILAGKGMDDAFDMRHPQTRQGPGGVGTFLGQLTSNIVDIVDRWQSSVQGREQSKAEVADNTAARKVAHEFTKAIEGEITREQLQQNLLRILGN
ncbi:hypothetical protein KDK77_08330 [bacterium]|nr:hypothetical protein [bacterium]MCP5461705.1 hypothetical protein [bacterium]